MAKSTPKKQKRPKGMDVNQIAAAIISEVVDDKPKEKPDEKESKGDCNKQK